MLKNIEIKNVKSWKDKEKLLLFSKCGVWDSKMSRFLKKQEPDGLLSNLGLKTPLSKIPLSGEILL